ncbi:response regulator [Sphingomonas cannabina]|uniref:response regulator n=1 Tax=Sphingomonas cannabina TaxID=2899123 RepID=UPI001F42E0DF|nr:response regulator [Sphingomonas cannabina]UIJ44190.1 response regulator [Sphingomonas cannabina]
MSGFAGKRILVVDDEPFIAMMLEDILGDLGCAVIGPALDLGEAEALARGAAIDAAILDVNLGNRTSHSIADLLRERQIPFVVASGSAEAATVPGASGTLNKPFWPAAVEAALSELIA